MRHQLLPWHERELASHDTDISRAEAGGGPDADNANTQIGDFFALDMGVIYERDDPFSH